jgi:hypothetical protein
MYNLNNPEKWQAASHPDLCKRKPEDLFQSEFAERYNRLHNDIWLRFIQLHGTIYTLEQLQHFPFAYLYCPGDMEFWHLVKLNFFEMAIVSLHSLVNDQGTDSHTIPKFKNEISAGPWLDQGMLDLFNQTLKERKFDRNIKEIADRIKEVRHNYIAHRLVDKQTGSPKKNLSSVSLRELRELFDAAHSLFGALSFGSAYDTLAGDLSPGTVGGKPTRTCLDEVLDAVIRESYFVKEPELKRLWWSDFRKRKAPEELKILNELRQRVGLPEA